jgi:hypothetical protein
MSRLTPSAWLLLRLQSRDVLSTRMCYVAVSLCCVLTHAYARVVVLNGHHLQ